MRNIAIILFLGFLLNPQVWSQETADKAALAKQFKEFISTNQKLRQEHEKEVYEMQKKFVEENYKLQTDLMKKIGDLENKLVFGEKEKNKEVRSDIRKTFKEFRKEMKERRKEFFKEKLKKSKQEFREKMKKRHSELKGELKAELDHPRKGRQGRKGKGHRPPPESDGEDEE